jgi:hypothetical protein
MKDYKRLNALARYRRFKKKWLILLTMIDEPCPESEICDRCKCIIVDYPGHIEVCHD